jgi:hypothetical protein
MGTIAAFNFAEVGIFHRQLYKQATLVLQLRIELLRCHPQPAIATARCPWQT